jgi:ribonuclease Z
MKFTFLGTSAGKPTRERNVSALALEFDQDNKWYLFDCGEATQHQLQKSPLSIGKLHTIFITHLHGDHIFGLPGLLASKKMDEALKPITIYGPKGIKKFIECAIEISQMHLGFDLDIIEFEANSTFTFDKFTIKTLPLIHSIESFAFYIKENDISNKLDEAKLRSIGLKPSPVYGEIKKGRKILHEGKELDPGEFMLSPIPGRKVIIAGDNQKPEILNGYLDRLDLLIHEATYTQEVYDNLAKKVLHTTAKDLGFTAQKHHIKNLIATHISARYNENGKLGTNILLEEIKKYYEGNTFIANDMDQFYLTREGSLEKIVI